MTVDADMTQRAAARRRGLRGRSLRFQIVSMLVVLLSVTFIAVAGATAVALHGFLVERLDQQLRDAGDRFSLSLEHPGDGDADDTGQFSAVAGQAAGTLGARVVNGSVTSIEVVAGRDDDYSVTARDKATVASLTATDRPRTVHFPDLGEYRVIVTAGTDGDLLVTGLPEHPVDDTIARLLLIEAVVFGVALLVTGGAAAAAVRWSLRPLHEVAATAREVAELPLSSGAVSLPSRTPPQAPGSEAGQVAEAFDHMLEHVEAALRERHASEDRLRRFIADASHELRTPVAVVRSHAEYAQLASADLPQPVSQALARITAESDRMGHLVQDLLLLARLDSGRQLEHSPVDMTRVVLDAVSDARVAGSDRRWRLDLPEAEVIVEGDPRALHQVVASLLANARMHTPPQTTVTTALTLEETRLELTVTDDGPGIDGELLPRVFDRFVRADAARSQTDGSGLGLSIVAAIVHAHGGKVSARSRSGQTTFTVELPVRQGQ